MFVYNYSILYGTYQRGEYLHFKHFFVNVPKTVVKKNKIVKCIEKDIFKFLNGWLHNF